jgi:RNA polymerase sigma-70 factor (ECF subfamily)
MAKSECTDEELVRGVLAGSRDAASHLFERHWEQAWRVAYSITGMRATADDIAQESLVQAFASLASFEGKSLFSTWLRRIIINRSLNVLRSPLFLPLEMPCHEDQSSTSDTYRSDEATRMVEAVRELPFDRRVVVVLRHWIGLSPAEIAELVDVPEGTVNSRLARGVEQLRLELEVSA